MSLCPTQFRHAKHGDEIDRDLVRKNKRKLGVSVLGECQWFEMGAAMTPLSMRKKQGRQLAQWCQGAPGSNRSHCEKKDSACFACRTAAKIN